MKNKKGFTLVELLAVVAILAILVIVAMPKVLEIFMEAKEDSFEVDLSNIYSLAETTYISESLNTSEKKLYCNVPGCEGKPLDIDIPDNILYSVKLNKRGEVMCFQATNGSFFYVSQGVVDKIDFKEGVYSVDDKTVDFKPDCYYSVDYKNIKRINVLNIYPDNTTSSFHVLTNEGTYTGVCDDYKKYQSSSLKPWMETPNEESSNGYGKGIIKVIPVSFTQFKGNPNPNYWVKRYYDNNCIQDEGEMENRTTADIMYIGTWDANAKTTYNTAAIDAIEAWTESGKPIIAGHDVLITSEDESKEITNRLIDNFGMKIAGSNSARSNKVHILSNKKRNVFTTWPWIIISGDEGLTIEQTHTTKQQVVDGEVWITLGPTKITEEQAKNNKFYLATYENTSMIQTGDSNAQATSDEQKIIANMLFYLNHYVF